MIKNEKTVDHSKVGVTMTILCLLLLFIAPAHCSAATLVSFANYSFAAVKYDDRIGLSSTSADEDFVSGISQDGNNDGVIDYLETETFQTSGEQGIVYAGNRHNSYDIARFLVFVGIAGTVDSFVFDGVTVTADDLSSVTAPDVFLKDTGLVDCLDQIVLFEIDRKLEDREPNNSAVGANDPYEITISNIMSSDPAVRFYCGAYGIIASGQVNSYTAHASTVLFMPALPASEGTEGSGAPVIPEPGTIILAAVGMVLTITRKKGA